MRGIKRGLITLSALAMLVSSNISQAHTYWKHASRLHDRAGWSPYAFNSKTKTGLISGHKGYSPYAFTHKNNGIEDKHIRWSPYAFTHKTSGLINENSYHHPPHPSFLFHNHSNHPTIFGDWFHEDFKESHIHTTENTKQIPQTPSKEIRKQRLGEQKNSKTPMSNYARLMRNNLLRKGIEFIETNDVETIIVPDKWIILQTPKSELDVKDYKGFSVIKLTTTEK